VGVAGEVVLSSTRKEYRIVTTKAVLFFWLAQPNFDLRPSCNREKMGVNKKGLIKNDIIRNKGLW
jgi:hypothetical protein